MTELLFDLGNTRLKYALRQADGAGAVGFVEHHGRNDFAALDPAVQGDVAWVAAVAPAQLRQGLLAELRRRFARVSFATTLPRMGALRIAYAEPGRLGVDRFLGLAVASEAEAAVLVAGVGTALTVDLVDASGVHRGGRIAPSPTLMRACLAARAPHLPAQGGDYAEFATDSDDALASGCEGAALALIERSRYEAAALLGAIPQLWMHGGGAAPLLPRLTGAINKPGLVMEGLARFAALADPGTG